MTLAMKLFWLLCGAAFSLQSHAAPHECTSYAKFSGTSYSEKSGSKLEVSNMPDVRNQGPLPICYAHTSTVIVQRAYCQSRSMSCQNLDAKDRITPLSLLAYAHRNTDIGLDNSAGNHTNLRMMSEGGSTAETLANANDFNTDTSVIVNSELCYPYDQMVKKYGADKERIGRVLGDLNRYYEKYKKQVAEGSYCADCAMKCSSRDLI